MILKFIFIATLIDFVCTQFVSSVAHAINMLRPCYNYKPSMEQIYFRYFDQELVNFYTINFRTVKPIPDTSCSLANNGTRTPFTIIVPGWREDCAVDYVRKAIKNLSAYRGGCIICMDYTNYSFTDNYKCLYRAFKEIRDVLYSFYLLLKQNNVDYDDVYVFGHSFGSQIALHASQMLGYKKIFAIDACDPAGILFDTSGFFRKMLLGTDQRNVRGAAKYVDCWHTSGFYGTKNRLACDRNWLIGRCGYSQPAAGQLNFSSHNLCPVFYNLSFKYSFPAIEQPNQLCSVSNPAKYWPDGFKLGYRERRKRLVHGQVFVNTSIIYPFNKYADEYNNVAYITMPADYPIAIEPVFYLHNYVTLQKTAFNYLATVSNMQLKITMQNQT